ncbi:Cof-type HAD-IIB family hydrolase [Alkalicoccobacillus porphyridii]|uniref:Cof-type HAD-IIB family hydrolase n=1 Tax=Alkalicoccobacillus porphyridii TaxID=2597270 RepID=A0A553ZVM7_9BACI|nr:Cof-type HAD-IIB family hydrolase [Alkalicoccobacillus porphyridii]TSB45366.1 Cof-type HAD-IIB family hydrolase [Alkalicoccobacillus porphyridii]
MDKAMIFFDIDGTLLDHQKNLPASAKQSIAALKQAGHEVAIATGRPPFFFEGLRKELGIDSFVSFNGQYVVYKGEEIFANPLDAASIEELTSFSAKRNHPLVYMNHHTMKSNIADHPAIEESLNSLKVHAPELDPLFHKDRDLYQTLLFCTEGEEKEYMESFTNIRFVRWHPSSVDVIPANGSKAVGISHLIKKLGFSIDQVYAFGDEKNDLEMLSQVGHGVAMGNAPQVVKDAANYVTKPVDEDGIEHGLKMVGLL